MTLFTFEFLTISVFVSFLIYKVLDYIHNYELYTKVSRFPGPRTLPFIGNAHLFIGNTKDILHKFINLLDTYSSSSPFRVWLGNRAFIVLHDAEQTKNVLLSPKALEKDDFYKFIRPWLGLGLFTAPVPIWRVHRKMIVQTFNPRILESFVEVFSNQSLMFLNRIKDEANGEEFEVFKKVSLFTLDTICETAMGVKIEAQTEENNFYAQASKGLMEIISIRIFRLWLHPDGIFNFTEFWKKQNEYAKHLKNVTDEVIRKKKSVSNNDTTENKNRKAFLDLLMDLSNNGTKLTNIELRDETDTMIMAGSDTTAAVNSYVILMLASHPEIQDKVYSELHAIYGSTSPQENPAAYHDLNRMAYLECVIKETMRIFPLGPLLVRKVSQDLDIGNGCVIPRNSSVVISPIALQRSEKYWPQPFKFDPDRFLPQNSENRHPFCYLPFSGGPRNCIGMKYAMMAMKVFISTLLREYILKKDNITPISEIKLKFCLMLQPVEPITIKIERRSSEPLSPSVNC